MAIIFEAAYSKKLGLPNFSSHSYVVSIRTELNGIDRVPEESSKLYKMLQEAVDKEIQAVGFMPDATKYGMNGDGNGEWKCSPKQRALIEKIISENKLDQKEIEDLAIERFGVGLTELNRLQGSGLIDELIERHGKGDRGNSRAGRRFQRLSDRSAKGATT
jgi:hypothetical protein